MADGKICVACGEDCSNTKRVKDKQGRYICGACLEKRRAKKAKAQQQASTGDDPNVAVLLADIPDPTDPDQLCPECGKLVKPGQAICLSCGFDTRSGKKVKTQISKAAKEPKKSGGGVNIDLSGAGGAILAVIATPVVAGGIAYAAPETAFPIMVAAGLISFVSYIMLLLDAMSEQKLFWVAMGVAGLCIQITSIPFVLYYGIFGSPNTRRKATYWASTLAAVAVAVSASSSLLATYERMAGEAADTPTSELATATPGTGGAECFNQILIVLCDEIMLERTAAGEGSDEYDYLLEWGSNINQYPAGLVDAARQRWASLPAEEQEYLREEACGG